MKGLVKFGPGKEGMEIRELPIPVPKGRDIRVKVMAAGVCGSDIHIMHDEIPVNMPVVLGHEYVGIVDETGDEVTKFKKGDWITSMTTYSSCGECIYCKEGKVMFCPDRKGLGFHVNGAMAEYMLVPEANSFKVPDEIEDKLIIGACEPFGCGVRSALERAVVNEGDVVVVCGPGTLGLSVIQAAKLRKAYVIAYGLPTDIHRLEMALKLGADEYSTDVEDLKKKVYAKNKYGADICFEVTGAEPVINMCIDITRKCGRIAQVGLYSRKPSVNINKMTDNEINFSNNFGCHRSTWELCLELIKDKKVDIVSYVETRIPLADWQRAFDIAESRGAFKVLILPNE